MASLTPIATFTPIWFIILSLINANDDDYDDAADDAKNNNLT